MAVSHQIWPVFQAVPAFQLLVVTPMSLSAGFASIAAFVVITVADLMTVGIGLALLGEPAARAPSARTQAVRA